MSVDQMPVGKADYGPEQYTDTQGRASLNLWPLESQGHRQRQLRAEHRKKDTHQVLG